MPSKKALENVPEGMAYDGNHLVEIVVTHVPHYNEDGTLKTVYHIPYPTPCTECGKTIKCEHDIAWYRKRAKERGGR